MIWHKGTPPRDGNTYLLKFYTNIICSGAYRRGTCFDPQPDVLDWRCDCCGRFATPKEWAQLNVDPTIGG